MSKNYRRVRKSTVVKNSIGQHFKLGGYRPEKQDSNDKKYSASRDRREPLPSKIDLRSYLTPVENQGDTNSCTANAMAGAYEYLANRLLNRSDDVSRLFIYYNARELDGDVAIDEGTYLKSCIKVLRKHGACSEATWAFNPAQILEQPPTEAYEEAANFVIEDAYRVKVDLYEMQSCLADGYPFAFGLQLFSSFQAAGSNGLVPMPDPDNEKHDGGHAMLCVGYSDPDQVFIVRNSWGEEWGEQGYCYIPYDYMTKPHLNGDCWVIRQVSDFDLSQDIQGNSSSLFDGATAAIASAFQSPGAIRNSAIVDLFNNFYTVEYEEELVYVEKGLLSVDACEDLESLYYQEYDEDEESLEDEETEDSYEEDEIEPEDSYEEEEEYEETEDEIEDSYEEDEETEDSYEEEDSEDETEEDETEDSYEEDEDETKETEDSYEEDEDETEDEKEYEETEDNYEEDEEEDSYEEDEEAADSYEESEDEDSD
ncbi:MAG: C1 family peptidase [Myxacorys californica WJT36-NPBG1]|jgi:C1A family cysteine protease|nr:C1 family peptidase [Myxacorys californica WJT36-NPBG1]